MQSFLLFHTDDNGYQKQFQAILYPNYSIKTYLPLHTDDDGYQKQFISGFRKGHSTGTCLLDFLDNIFLNSDKGVPSGVLFLDLRKAFDTVDRGILSRKLKEIGIRNSSVRWFEFYLDWRTQVTKVDGVLSTSAFVTCGVPQGSILGPRLFSIYINDLPFVLNKYKTHLYADDTAVTISSNNSNELNQELNAAMDILQSWFNNNRLSLNTSKSKYMRFGTQGQLNNLRDICVQMNDLELEQVVQYKYLGVVLDAPLNFSAHIEHLKSKTLSKIRFLGRLRSFVDHETSLMHYNTLILPLFDYCDIVCHCLNYRDQHILQKLQNCALRNTVQCKKLPPTSELHDRCSIEYLSIRRSVYVSNEMFKVTNKRSPVNIQNTFELTSEIHFRSTRGSLNERHNVPRCRLETGKRNFRYRGAKNWNCLPLELRQSSSPTSTRAAT